MQEAIGYSLAAVVAGTLLFILFGVSKNGQDVAVAAKQYRGGKANMMTLAATVEGDLRNVGSNFTTWNSTYLSPDSVITGYDPAGTPKVFEFIAQTQPDSLPKIIRYEWQDSGLKVLVGDSAMPLQRWTRYVNGTQQQAIDLTGFDVQLLDRNGNAVVDVVNARQISVNAKHAPSLGAIKRFGSAGAEALGDLEWHHVVHPIALTRLDDLALIAAGGPGGGPIGGGGTGGADTGGDTGGDKDKGKGGGKGK